MARIRTVLAALAITPLLAACGSNATPVEDPPAEAAPAPGEQSAPDGQQEPPTPSLPTWQAADGPAEWSCFDPSTGVEHKIAVPTDTSDERIAALEDFRANAGAEPVNYVLVETDATNATTPGRHGIWGATWATADQQNVTANRAMLTVLNWPGWSSSPSADMPEVEQDANSGATGFTILFTDEPVESMVAPMVAPGATEVPCDLY